MRLINADELMELYDGLEDRGLVIPIDVVIQNIKDMPTAYDIDWVMKELEEMSKYEVVENKFEQAIEIVKKGGVADET